MFCENDVKQPSAICLDNEEEDFFHWNLKYCETNDGILGVGPDSTTYQE